MSEQRALIFEGLDHRFEVPPEEWAEILLFLEDWGWQPEQLRTSYLGAGVQVSHSDSRNLAVIAQRVLDAALKDPATVYPAPFNMTKLYEFAEFCGAGGFRRSE
jgi:hypothetical protein